MAAASLDVNFKEELSAIEQCRFYDLYELTSFLTASQGSAFSRRLSVQLLFTVSYSTRRRCKSASLSPFCSKWQEQIL